MMEMIDLDRQIAERLFGWTRQCSGGRLNRQAKCAECGADLHGKYGITAVGTAVALPHPRRHPPFSTDLTEARAVVDRMRSEIAFGFELRNYLVETDGQWEAYFLVQSARVELSMARCDSPAEAICRAALSALEKVGSDALPARAETAEETR